MMYFISGVWKNDDDVITDVLLHEANYSGGIWLFDEGIKTPEADVISLLRSNNEIHTIVWLYSGKYWEIKAHVRAMIQRYTGKVCLRSAKDETTRDNLDNLLNFTNFFADSQ